MSNQRKQAIIVSHTHWDRAWYLTFNQFRFRLVTMIDRILELLENNDDYACFVLDGQVVLIDDYLEIKPQNKARLKKLISSGKLIIGPWYILPDLFLVSSESIIRNLQFGLETAETYGHSLNIGYVPDPFGHIAQLPQLLNGFDLDTFIFMRGMPDELARKDTLVFTWKSSDGSSVLAYYIKDGYFNTAALGQENIVGRFDLVEPDPKKAKEQIYKTVNLLEKNYPHDLFLFNNGVDHMPEQPQLPAILFSMNNNFEDLSIKHGSFSDFVELLKKKECDYQYSGDLIGNPDHPILLSVYSTRLYLKQQNHKAQSLLEKYTEPLGLLSSELLKSNFAHHQLLDYTWKKLLQNHPHDDICGCSVDGVHQDNEVRFREVQENGASIILDTLEQMAMMGFEKTGPSELRYRDVFLYNPHPHIQKYRIETEVVFPNYEKEEEEILPEYELNAIDGTGNPIDLKILESNAPHFKAEFIQYTWGRSYLLEFDIELSPLGYEIVRVFETQNKIKNKAPNTEEPRIENEQYRLSFENNKLVFEDKNLDFSFRDFIRFEYVQDNGDTYSFSRFNDKIYYSKLETVYTHPSKSDTLVAEILLNAPSSLSDSSQVGLSINVELTLNTFEDISIKVDYENCLKDGRLRLLLPVGFHTHTTFADAHFRIAEHQKRFEIKKEADPERYESYPGEFNYPTNHQNDFCFATGGAVHTWVANKGLPEYELVSINNESYFAITINRSVAYLSVSNGSIRRPHAGPKLATPEAQCLRPITAELSYGITNKGIGTVIKNSKAFSHPAWDREFPVIHNLPKDGPLKRRREFLSIDNPLVLLSSFKPSKDSSFKILRVYNSSLENQTAVLSLGFNATEFMLSNLKEKWSGQPVSLIENNQITLDLAPNKIVTLLIR